jgi:hypothetical protein
MKQFAAISIGLILTNCARQGYHYEQFEFFTQTPNDPCWRSEVVSEGTVQWLNTTVGKPRGVPGQVTAISAPSGFDRGWFTTISRDYRSSAELACHATLTLASGKKVSGLFFVDDIGKYDNGVWKGLDVSWISDDAITTELLRQKRLPPGSTTYFPSAAIGPVGVKGEITELDRPDHERPEVC